MKNSKNIPVGIIGLGMVGDPIRKWFEEIKGYRRGIDLFCFDVDERKGFSDDINKADIVFISVPTPTPRNKAADVSIVRQAIKTVRNNKIIVIKSTVPPGTIERLQKEFPKKKLIFNPEFLTESQVWSDFIRPDRQILGSTKNSRPDIKEVQALLPIAPFSRPWSSDYSKKEANATEAELAKYASNVFGYIKVIYGNIFADVSTAISEWFHKLKIESSVDYEHIREIISADPRIGPAWLNVNHGDYSGAGGFCFPKDMNALIYFIEKELIPGLKKNTGDKGLIESLKNGLKVFKSVRSYNRALLKWQGLSENELMRHAKDVDLSDKKEIRVNKHKKS